MGKIQVNTRPEETSVTGEGLKQSTEPKQAETQATAQNDSKIEETTQETDTKSTEQEPQKAPEVTPDTDRVLETNSDAKLLHVVEYVGNGAWIDSENVTWGKSGNGIINTKQFTDKEYQKRSDIHFMVTYGEMKHTEVNA